MSASCRRRSRCGIRPGKVATVAERSGRYATWLGPPEQRLAPGDGERLLEPRGFRARDVLAERCEGVGPPPFVACRRMDAGLANQPLREEAFDDAVERAGAQPDGPAGETLDLLHDRVAVRVAVGQRDEDVEHRGRERKQIAGI